MALLSKPLSRLATALPLCGLVLLLALGACAPKDDNLRFGRARPAAPPAEKLPIRAEHKGNPQISHKAVRDWFATVQFKGYKRLSIFSEFHPDEGSLVARFGKGPQVFYLSYIDNQRMSQFGLPRSAEEILCTGENTRPETATIQGETWYCRAEAQPLLAVDVTGDVKLLFMGYQGLTLEDLQALAEELPLQALRAKVGH